MFEICWYSKNESYFFHKICFNFSKSVTALVKAALLLEYQSFKIKGSFLTSSTATHLLYSLATNSLLKFSFILHFTFSLKILCSYFTHTHTHTPEGGRVWVLFCFLVGLFVFKVDTINWNQLTSKESEVICWRKISEIEALEIRNRTNHYALKTKPTTIFLWHNIAELDKGFLFFSPVRVCEERGGKRRRGNYTAKIMLNSQRRHCNKLSSLKVFFSHRYNFIYHHPKYSFLIFFTLQQNLMYCLP